MWNGYIKDRSESIHAEGRGGRESIKEDERFICGFMGSQGGSQEVRKSNVLLGT